MRQELPTRPPPNPRPCWKSQLYVTQKAEICLVSQVCLESVFNGVWRVFKGCLECIWRLSVRCLMGVCASAGNKEGVWSVQRRDQKFVWRQFFVGLKFLEPKFFGKQFFDQKYFLSKIHLSWKFWKVTFGPDFWTKSLFYPKFVVRLNC